MLVVCLQLGCLWWRSLSFPVNRMAYSPVTDTTNWLQKLERGTLIDAGKEVGLEVNAEKTKYMLLSRHQNAG
jgi:hypothetical protein